MSELIGNPNCCFFHAQAQIKETQENIDQLHCDHAADLSSFSHDNQKQIFLQLFSYTTHELI